MATTQQLLIVRAASEGRLTPCIGLSHEVVLDRMMGMSDDSTSLIS